jgi:hypothetical protein
LGRVVSGREFIRAATDVKKSLVLTRSWEILWLHALLFGQFHGSTPQLIAQFQGISLEKSQPDERTFAGRMTPSKPTFGRL